MAIRASSSLGAVATGTPIPMNWQGAFPASVQVAGTFVATYSVEYTLDNLLDSSVTPTWTARPSGSGLSAAANLKVDFPVAGLRLNVTAYTSGTVVMKVLQGDAGGK